DFTGKARFFCRLLDALARTIEFPAVINAPDGVAIDPAKMHLCAAMRTSIIDDLRVSGLAAEQGVVLAHDPDRFGVAGFEVLAPINRHPELAHEFAARGAGKRCGSIDLRIAQLFHSGVAR